MLDVLNACKYVAMCLRGGGDQEVALFHILSHPEVLKPK